MSRLNLSLAAATLGAAVALCAAPAGAKTLDVVLLGDSYTSGVGAGDYAAGNDCGRSPYTWGEVYGQMARAKGLTVNVTNAACGGSTVAELDPQIPAVTSSTDLVLMATGGNDTDVSDAAFWCFVPLVAGPNSCRTRLSSSLSKAPGVEPALLQRLRVLRTKLRPGGRLVFLSYPYLATDSGYELKTWFASYAAGTAIRQLGEALDVSVMGAIDTANAEAGADWITFVPLKDRFAGHEPDPNPWQENPARWLNELTNLPAGLSDAFHPNAEGYRQMGAQVMASAGAAGDFGVAQE